MLLAVFYDVEIMFNPFWVQTLNKSVWEMTKCELLPVVSSAGAEVANHCTRAGVCTVLQSFTPRPRTSELAPSRLPAESGSVFFE